MWTSFVSLHLENLKISKENFQYLSKTVIELRNIDGVYSNISDGRRRR